MGSFSSHQVDERLRATFPTQGWRWRQDWDGRPIRDAGADRFVWFVVSAIAFAVATCLMLHQRLVENRTDLPWVVILVCAVGAVFLIGHVTQRLWVVWRYGVASFLPSAVPGRVGGVVAGWVHFPGVAQHHTPASVALRCERREETKTGRDEAPNVSRTELWKHTQHVRGTTYADLGRTVIPVLIAVPPDAPESDCRQAEVKTVWELVVAIPAAGPAFAATFEIPVFRVEEDCPPADLEELRAEQLVTGEADEAAIATAGLRAFRTARGLEIKIYPVTPLLMRIVLPLGAIACAVVAEISKQPLWWLGAMIVAGIAFENIFDYTVVMVSRAGIEVRRLRPWGFQTRRHSWLELEPCQMEVVANPEAEYYRVYLPATARSGAAVTLAKLVRGKASAEAVCRGVESYRSPAAQAPAARAISRG